MKRLSVILCAMMLASACVGDVTESQSNLEEGSAALVEGDFVVHAPNQFRLGGQSAWFHDSGHRYGFFHTYDALNVCDQPRKVHVFLPREYEQRRTRYPVIYMHDGDTTFWPGGAAGKTWGVAETIDALAQERAIQDVIVVAMHPRDRDREYTHTFWAPGRASGGLPGYTSYVADCIKPFIDRHYHTDPSAERTAVVGSSHGGLAAFFMATRRPDAFGIAGALSPSFWVGLDLGLGGGPLSRSPLLRGADATLRTSRPKLWIDWGLKRTGGFHNSVIERMATDRAQEMVDLLTRDYQYTQDQELFWHEDPVGGHDEDAWRHRFSLFLRAMYPSR